MDGGQFRIILYLALQIHLPEHVQSGFFMSLAQAWPSFGFQGASQLPTGLTALEPESLAIVTSSDDLGLAGPEQAPKGQKLRGNTDDCLGRLVGRAGIDNGDTAVMGSKG